MDDLSTLHLWIEENKATLQQLKTNLSRVQKDQTDYYDTWTGLNEELSNILEELYQNPSDLHTTRGGLLTLKQDFEVILSLCKNLVISLDDSVNSLRGLPIPSTQLPTLLTLTKAVEQLTVRTINFMLLTQKLYEVYAEGIPELNEKLPELPDFGTYPLQQILERLQQVYQVTQGNNQTNIPLINQYLQAVDQLLPKE